MELLLIDAAVDARGNVNADMLDYEAGVWFGGDTAMDALPDGTPVGAFVYSKTGYTLEENNVGTKGSDDFVHIAKMARKGATFFDLGCGREHAPLHRPDFDFDDSLIPVGLDIICRVCLHILQSR